MTANPKFFRDGQRVKGRRNYSSVQLGHRGKDVQEGFKGNIPLSQKIKNETTVIGDF